MLRIESSIEIEKPASLVFSWIEDPEKAVLWQEGIGEWEILVKKEGRVGTRFREYVEENGQGTWMAGEITDYILDQQMGFALDGDFNSVEVDFAIEAGGARCVVRQRANIRFKGVAKIAGLLAKGRIRAQMLADLKKLKALCELG